MKASKHEACSLPRQAESCFKCVQSKTTDMKDKAKAKSEAASGSCYGNDVSLSLMESEQWETILFNLNDSARDRQIVGSIAGSCLTAATPLVASTKQSACMVTLDIVEDQSTGKTIGTGRKSQELYYIQSTSPAVCAVTESPELLHYRLGHPSIAKLRRMVPSLSKLEFLDCESCQLGKHWKGIKL